MGRRHRRLHGLAKRALYLVRPRSHPAFPMLRPLAAALLVSLAAAAAAQPAAPERHADVRVVVPEAGLTAAMHAALELDHAAPDKTADGARALRATLSETQIAAARALGLHVEVLVADLAAEVARKSAAGCPTAPDIYGSMGCYPTRAESLDILERIRAARPEIVSERFSIGQSVEGREIWAYEVSDNPGVDEGEPEALVVALHHAREAATLTSTLYFLWHLVEGYGTDPEVTRLVDSRRLFVVPMLNPDGYVHNQQTDPGGGGFWRKNRRPGPGSTVGVDLNRNYGYLWGLDNSGSSPDPGSQTYRGTGAFSEPETAALRDFLEDGRSVRIALNVHTYSNLLLYPWDYEVAYTPDHETFVRLADRMTAVNGYTAGIGPEILYPVNGGSDDWMYGEQTTKPAIYAFTPELGSAADGFWPPPSRILPLAETNLDMFRQALRLAGPSVQAEAVRLVSDSGDNGFADPGETAVFAVDLRNAGLSPGETAGRLVAASDAVEVLDGGVWSGETLPPDGTVSVLVTVQLADDAPLGTAALFELDGTVTDGAVAPEVPPARLGTTRVLFADDATDADAWASVGTWGPETGDYVSAPASFADSPGRRYASNARTSLTLRDPLDLRDANGATLRFMARWDLENVYDYVAVEASADGDAWTALEGRHTNDASGRGAQPDSGPIYDGEQADWVEETLSLEAFDGEAEVHLRFVLGSDGSFTGDGFFVDDLSVEIVERQLSTSAGDARGELAVALLAPRPNPAAGAVSIPLTLGRASDATVRVLDLLGRTVAVVHEGALAAGPHALRWDAAGLTPGLYLLRLDAAGRSATRPITILR